MKSIGVVFCCYVVVCFCFASFWCFLLLLFFHVSCDLGLWSIQHLWVYSPAMSSNSLIHSPAVSICHLFNSAHFFLRHRSFYSYKFNLYLFISSIFLFSMLIFPSRLLCIWNAVVITVFMPLSTYSIICVISGSVSFEFSFPYYKLCLLLLFMPGNVCLGSRDY